MKLKLIQFLQFFILIAYCIALGIFIYFKAQINVVAIAIAIGALLYAVLIVIEEALEGRNTKKEICYLESREKDESLLKDMQNKLKELDDNSKTIDSIKIVEATGYDDHRKEVYIIYH